MRSTRWKAVRNGQKEFLNGQQDWLTAANEAASCTKFVSDVDEEQAADEPRSCYNCRYRRWTAASFTCLAEGASCCHKA